MDVGSSAFMGWFFDGGWLKDEDSLDLEEKA